MKKALVIGSGGAGKSTFAKRLGAATGIEVIHLDKLYWRPGWVKMPKEEWADTVRELLSGDSWIMDGNFGGTREMRIEACDTVIFLDIPRRVCLYRIAKRLLVYHGKSRPDMTEGCNERFDREFIAWVFMYPYRARPRILAQLERYSDKEIIVLGSRREADAFISKL